MSGPLGEPGRLDDGPCGRAKASGCRKAGRADGSRSASAVGVPAAFAGRNGRPGLSFSLGEWFGRALVRRPTGRSTRTTAFSRLGDEAAQEVRARRGAGPGPRLRLESIRRRRRRRRRRRALLASRARRDAPSGPSCDEGWRPSMAEAGLRQAGAAHRHWATGSQTSRPGPSDRPPQNPPAAPDGVRLSTQCTLD